jgi:4-diphosphocytidyl-2-C-methyl-D-erythritol kinase
MAAFDADSRVSSPADAGTMAPDAPRVEHAPAKVNLTLHVLGRRGDGYHDLESLVAFARHGDRLTFTPGDEFALAVGGPNAERIGEAGDNLVLKAVRALAARIDGLRLGSFHLEKRLPVAAGLGGGSADAAAALRLIACHNGIALDDGRLFEAARLTGADVPVCLEPRARTMRGIGDVLSAPLGLPPLPAVLVNPGVAVPTRDVFAALGIAPGAQRRPADAAEVPRQRAALLTFLAGRANDLEPAALAVAPAIATTLAALRAVPGCRLARMSGSGATCFALFPSAHAASAAARSLVSAHPSWWVRATTLA